MPNRDERAFIASSDPGSVPLDGIFPTQMETACDGPERTFFCDDIDVICPAASKCIDLELVRGEDSIKMVSLREPLLELGVLVRRST